MRESEIERYLVKQVAKAGGRAYKWVSPGNRGVPDRIVVLPNHSAIFVELKSADGILSLSQCAQIKWLRGLGQKVHIINSKKMVDEFIRYFSEI